MDNLLKMNYEDTLKFLYEQLPMFQRIGGAAYKAGLDTSIQLSKMFNDPHKAFKCIHVGGTNGKGSVSHLLATTLQLNGYKVGLYTSPHLIDFRERIRVNGEMIPQEDVISFVDKYLKAEHDFHPSFFELTMMMAFDFFRKEKVDYAIIEVGLGGRLDSTNIISPILSVITNISFDHVQFLGDTLPKIASEKAGIIKPGIPVVIGEAEGDVKKVFENKARESVSKIIFSEENNLVETSDFVNGQLFIGTSEYGRIACQLSGDCQTRNANTVLNAVNVLKSLCVNISNQSVVEAFGKVCDISGLMGRWMKLNDSPKVICDTGHNVGGFQYISQRLKSEECKNLRIVIGFVNDKDVSHILEMLPKNAVYYFAQASVKRALESGELKKLAHEKGLIGESYPTVEDAYKVALCESSKEDFIYVGGSTFIVADLLAYLK